MTEPYPREETDLMHKLLDTKIDNNYQQILVALERQELAHKQFANTMQEGFSKVYARQDELDSNQKFTNGKIKKVIMGVIFLAGIVVGLGLLEITDAIKILL